MYLVILLYAILASTFAIAKTALMYAKPFFLIGFRMTTAGLLMLGVLYFFNRKSFRFDKKDWKLFLGAIFFHIYLAFIPEFWALQYLSSSKVNLIYSSTPFIAAILSYFLLQEKLGIKKFFGMLIGLGGLIPIFMTQTDPRESMMQIFSVSAPELVLLFAVTSAAYAWFIIKKLIAKKYSLLMINGISMFGGGTLALITSLTVEGTQTSPIFDLWPFLGWTVLLMFVANGIVYNFYGWLLKTYSITFVTTAGFLCPIFGAIYGWFFLGEQITWHYFVSLAFIIIGLFTFFTAEKKSAKKTLPEHNMEEV